MQTHSANETIPLKCAALCTNSMQKLYKNFIFFFLSTSSFSFSSVLYVCDSWCRLFVLTYSKKEYTLRLEIKTIFLWFCCRHRSLDAFFLSILLFFFLLVLDIFRSLASFISASFVNIIISNNKKHNYIL